MVWLQEKELEILVDKKISDYVQVIIDEDEDVRIIDNFMGVTESILPKEEAIEVLSEQIIPASDSEDLEANATAAGKSDIADPIHFEDSVEATKQFPVLFLYILEHILRCHQRCKLAHRLK